MATSYVTEAAREGRIEIVKAVIARGGVLDGSEGECFDDDVEGCVRGAPYATPLGEAARFGHVEIVRTLLDAGALVDGTDYRGETALILASSWDQPAAVDLLIERGANVNHVGCLGTALAAVQPGWKPNAIAIAKKLLAAGASPTVTAPYTRSAITKHTDRKPEKKVAKKLLELLQLMLPHAGEQASIAQKAIDAIAKQVGGATKAAAKTGATLDSLARADSKSWPADVRKLAGKITSEADRERIEAICRRVLATPAAVAHPGWPAVVRDMIAMSKSYADATKVAYGKALPLSKLESDEGGAMDQFADDHLYTWDWLLDMLAQAAPRAHPGWAELMIDLCEAKQQAVGSYSFGDEEVAALLTNEGVRAHARFDDVFVVAKRAFPYASCFGADGALRDHVPVKAAPPKKAPPKKAPPKKR